jgi:hypothetical protein
MIVDGANDKYIQNWAIERQQTLSLKALKTHKLEHLQAIENSTVELLEADAIYLTLDIIENELQIDYKELLTFFAANKIKVNRQKNYDLIEIMRHLINRLSEEANSLNARLEEIEPTSDSETIRKLKGKKLKAQARLLNAVADVKEIKLKQMLKELVLNKELENQWSYSLVGFKAKLESIPNKVALELSSVTDESKVLNVLTKLITEALEELENGSRKII